jgi:hypothetical protein
MKINKTNLILIVCILVLVAGLMAIILTQKPTPVALLMNYGLDKVWQEAQVMNECVECHHASDFHSCETCHDEHGSVIFDNIRFYAVIELTGDVPDPGFVRINQILPYQENFETHITLDEFLTQHGIIDFESITFMTNDGGLVTIPYENLDKTSMLVPYLDGVRFVTESVHQSTWLKAITKIVIVSQERSITIDNEPTSIGRLLLNNSVNMTVEGSDVFLTGDDGHTRDAFVANRVEGALLLPLLANPETDSVIVKNLQGEKWSFSPTELVNAILSMNRGTVTLILPDRGRVNWPTNVSEVQSQ